MIEPDLYANPYSYYLQLRRSGRIHFNPSIGASGSWMIPRYDDVAAAFKNPNLSAARSHLLFHRYPPDVQSNLSRAAGVYRSWAVFSDPPTHTFWRRVIVLPFLEERLVRLSGAIECRINSLITALQTTVPIDLVHFAGLVPMHVMSLILGIPEQDCSQLAAWASELREFIWGHSASPLEIAMKTQDVLLSLHAYFKEIVRHSAAINGTGIAMMVEAVNTGITGDRRQEALRQTLPSQCCALLVAGYYTTADLLSNGIYALLRHPEQLRLIIENAELSREAAREASRYDSPVHTDGRIVTQKCELLGRTLEPGQMVVNLIASANHDEEKFPEPDIFNIYRAMPQKALTFGTSRHHCVGERLALMELALVFRNLVPKFPRIRLLQHNIEYKRDLRLRGVKTLPVILQPE